MKKCKGCSKDKPLSEYHKHKGMLDGHKSYCKPCFNERSAVSYSKRREAKQAKAKEWEEANKDVRYALTAKRRASKLQRTPPWADTKAMTAIYAHAKFLEKITGLEHHVDHIVPLQSPVVSGFHVENNLQCIPASVNLSKNNSFDLEAQQ